MLRMTPGGGRLALNCWAGYVQMPADTRFGFSMFNIKRLSLDAHILAVLCKRWAA